MSTPEIPAELTSMDPAWFNYPGKIEADLGCARGHFIVAAARENPTTRFLGVEWQLRRARETQRKLRHHGLDNARVLRGEILETLQKQVPDHSLHRLHILFPDPWPKRRHAPRRLLQPAAWNEFTRILHPRGIVRFLTDDAPYFQQTRDTLQNLPGWNILTDDSASVQEGWPPTEFQARFQRLQQPIYGLLAESRP
jgi:tRNA (guanine-N7-)-methyltransferase